MLRREVRQPRMAHLSVRHRDEALLFRRERDRPAAVLAQFVIGPASLEEHDDLLRDVYNVCGRILAPARVDDPVREQVFLTFSEDVGVLARALEPLFPALQCSVELRALDAREELGANDSLGPKFVAVTTAHSVSTSLSRARRNN